MQELRCKTCEALIDLSTAHDGVIECRFCHNVYTVPTATEDVKQQLLIAENELDRCDFEHAFAAYAKAAQIEPNEPEAHFGLALASFKVQYIRDTKDPEHKRLQPICHDISGKWFSDSQHYLKAIELATDEQRKVYEKRAGEIDAIGTEFYRLKKSGLRYDCFISVKVSDDKGGNTQDSYEALKLYNYLKKEGYKPFYSEEEMQGRVGVDYAALILYALYTSECMLVVCTNEDYLLTPWVRNEYTQFTELMEGERKDADAIAIVFKGNPIQNLPGRKGKLQGVSLNSATAYVEIKTYVDNHTPEARARKLKEAEEARQRELEKAKKAAEQEQLLAEMRAREKEREAKEQEQARRLAEMQEKLEAMQANKPDSGQIDYRRLIEEQKKFEQEECEKAARLAEEKRQEELRLAEQKRREAELLAEQKRREAELHPTLDNYKKEYFDINGTTLVRYKGNQTNIIIPYGVTSIGDKAFKGCNSLTSIMIPDSVRSIGDNAFYYCISLTSITIPENVRSIGNSAFHSCYSLTSITVPDRVTSIGNSVFASCHSLTSIMVAKGNTKYHSAGNCLIGTKSKTLIAGCKNSIIPTDGSVTSIGDNAFHGCNDLTSITIPDSVTSIGNSAFDGCTYLTSITIPDSVTSIGDSVFSECYKLTSIKIPESVTSIEWNAFSRCPIEEATIPAFACSYIKNDKLKTVVITGGDSIGDKTFEGCSSLTSITIPDSVTSIGGRAFKGCHDLTSITIPAGVTSIGEYAFCSCINLTSITIPDSVTNIGDSAFRCCNSLTSITIPNSVTSIGQYAFFSNLYGGMRSCSNLKTVTMPKKLKKCIETAFDNKGKGIKFIFTK